MTAVSEAQEELLKADINLHPSAAEAIKRLRPDTGELVEKMKERGVSVVTAEDVERAFGDGEGCRPHRGAPESNTESPEGERESEGGSQGGEMESEGESPEGERESNTESLGGEKESEGESPGVRGVADGARETRTADSAPRGRRHEREGSGVRIGGGEAGLGGGLHIDRDRDITSRSFSSGKVDDWLKMFNDRFARLEAILRRSPSMSGAQKVEVLKESGAKEGKVVGMVGEAWETKNGHTLIDIEDTSGDLRVLVPAKDSDLKRTAEEIVPDEVIGVRGVFSGKGDLFVAKDIHFPDVPHDRNMNRSPGEVSVALISDMHVGNERFREDAFGRFVRWLGGEWGSPAQKRLAATVGYVLVGGDMVDGVGNYPGQEGELEISDVKEQYSRLYEFVERIPDHIQVMVLPGNHDATRLAEPQPAVGKEYAPQLHGDPRVHMAGNPAEIVIHGVRIVSYHGKGIDDLVKASRGLTHDDPTGAMLALMKKRHLAPIYGGGTHLAAECPDRMVLEPVPDILHTAHTHVAGSTTYRNTLLVNSGTFQEQTPYQEGLGIHPEPGKVPVVGLRKLQTVFLEL